VIGSAMTQALREWAAEGGPSFTAELLRDAPEPHDLCQAASWRTRFALACEVGPTSTVKALVETLNDWLSGDRFHSAVVLDAELSADCRQALFQVVVWHRGGGEKAADAPNRGPLPGSRTEVISAGKGESL